ncbi:MAG: hypothetical protein OXG23_11780, partial [Chloroflexi bacterium]|nr:hypothetical protein [Chloroflexota bacterium]
VNLILIDESTVVDLTLPSAQHHPQLTKIQLQATINLQGPCPNVRRSYLDNHCAEMRRLANKIIKELRWEKGRSTNRGGNYTKPLGKLPQTTRFTLPPPPKPKPTVRYIEHRSPRHEPSDPPYDWWVEHHRSNHYYHSKK